MTNDLVVFYKKECWRFFTVIFGFFGEPLIRRVQSGFRRGIRRPDLVDKLAKRSGEAVFI